VRVKQSNPLPNETNSHGLFFVEISVSQVTKTMQISAKLNHRIAFCLIAAAVVAVCVKLVQKKTVLNRTLCLLNFLNILKRK
jgi:hypothetical protein